MQSLTAQRHNSAHMLGCVQAQERQVCSRTTCKTVIGKGADLLGESLCGFVHSDLRVKERITSQAAAKHARLRHTEL